MSVIDKISVLIPDGQGTLAMWAVLGLSLQKEVDIYILSDKNDAMAKDSGRIKGFYYMTFDTPEQWISNINTIVVKYDIDIVMPVAEDGIKNIILNKENLPFADKLSILPDNAVFDLANNKGRLAQHMEKYNISHPKTLVYNANQRHDVDDIDFPIILKPLYDTGGGKGICSFDNQIELDNFYNNSNLEGDYIVQELIDGYDMGFNVFCKEGEILAYTIQKATMKSHEKFAPQIAVKFLFKKEIYDLVERLVKSLNWSGVANVDIRYDNKRDKYNIIEINPRYWESLDASIAVGVNFPYLVCLASLNKSFPLPKYKFEEYVNLLGLNKRVKQNIFFIFRFKFILNNTPLRFFKRDFKPFRKILMRKFMPNI